MKKEGTALLLRLFVGSSTTYVSFSTGPKKA
jgi:hypothetical protein